MLEDTDRRVAHLEQAIRGFRRLPPPVVSVRAVVERYLRHLRATFGTNVDAARNLSLSFEKIVLRPEGQSLVPNFCGNLTAVLELEPIVLVALMPGARFQCNPAGCSTAESWRRCHALDRGVPFRGCLSLSLWRRLRLPRD
jgi:hypothetical protein